MQKLSLIAAILLLSAWGVAQNTPSPSQNLASGAVSAQQPDKAQAGAKTGTSDQSAQTIEGCLSGGADAFKLTDATGKTYELTGDTSGLAENVGHQVRLWGNAGTSGGGERTSAGGARATFGVKKVKSLAPSCK